MEIAAVAPSPAMKAGQPAIRQAQHGPRLGAGRDVDPDRLAEAEYVTMNAQGGIRN
jgi:hypothetical protein